METAAALSMHTGHNASSSFQPVSAGNRSALSAELAAFRGSPDALPSLSQLEPAASTASLSSAAFECSRWNSTSTLSADISADLAEASDAAAPKTADPAAPGKAGWDTKSQAMASMFLDLSRRSSEQLADSAPAPSRGSCPPALHGDTHAAGMFGNGFFRNRSSEPSTLRPAAISRSTLPSVDGEMLKLRAWQQATAGQQGAEPLSNSVLGLLAHHRERKASLLQGQQPPGLGRITEAGSSDHAAPPPQQLQPRVSFDIPAELPPLQPARAAASDGHPGAHSHAASKQAGPHSFGSFAEAPPRLKSFSIRNPFAEGTTAPAASTTQFNPYLAAFDAAGQQAVRPAVREDFHTASGGLPCAGCIAEAFGSADAMSVDALQGLQSAWAADLQVLESGEATDTDRSLRSRSFSAEVSTDFMVAARNVRSLPCTESVSTGHGGSLKDEDSLKDGDRLTTGNLKLNGLKVCEANSRATSAERQPSSATSGIDEFISAITTKYKRHDSSSSSEAFSPHAPAAKAVMPATAAARSTVVPAQRMRAAISMFSRPVTPSNLPERRPSTLQPTMDANLVSEVMHPAVCLPPDDAGAFYFPRRNSGAGRRRSLCEGHNHVEGCLCGVASSPSEVDCCSFFELTECYGHMDNSIRSNGALFGSRQLGPLIGSKQSGPAAAAAAAVAPPAAAAAAPAAAAAAAAGAVATKPPSPPALPAASGALARVLPATTNGFWTAQAPPQKWPAAATAALEPQQGVRLVTQGGAISAAKQMLAEATAMCGTEATLPILNGKFQNDSGGICSLLQLLQYNASGGATLRALAVVRTLAVSAPNAAAICDCSGMAVLVDLLLRGGSPGVVEGAAATIAELARHTCAQVALVEAHGVPVLASLLWTGTQPQLLLAALRALHALALHSLPNPAPEHAAMMRDAFSAAVVRALLHALQQHGPLHAALLEAGLQLLLCLAQGGARGRHWEALREEDTMQGLLVLLKRPGWERRPHAAPLVKLLAALAGDAALVSSFCSAGGMPPLVAAVHPGQGAATAAAPPLVLPLLRRLSQHTAAQAAILAVGGVPAAVQLLGSCSSPAAQVDCLYLLSALAATRDARSAMKEAGAPAALMRLLRSTTEHRLQVGAVSLMSLLANDACAASAAGQQPPHAKRMSMDGWRPSPSMARTGSDGAPGFAADV